MERDRYARGGRTYSAGAQIEVWIAAVNPKGRRVVGDRTNRLSFSAATVILTFERGQYFFDIFTMPRS